MWMKRNVVTEKEQKAETKWMQNEIQTNEEGV
jgi:hypothetical protein